MSFDPADGGQPLTVSLKRKGFSIPAGARAWGSQMSRRAKALPALSAEAESFLACLAADDWPEGRPPLDEQRTLSDVLRRRGLVEVPVDLRISPALTPKGAAYSALRRSGLSPICFSDSHDIRAESSAGEILASREKSARGDYRFWLLRAGRSRIAIDGEEELAALTHSSDDSDVSDPLLALSRE